MTSSKKDAFIYRMLHRWHGDENVDAAFLSFRTKKAKSLDDALKNVMKKYVPASVLAAERLRQDWAEFAGAEGARHSVPVFIKEKVLHVEVAHPIYLMGLNSPAIKKQILSKIHAVFGEKLCGEIKFIPPGARAK